MQILNYPFNRKNLGDALFHAVIYQHSLELNLGKNPGDGNQFITFDFSNSATKGRSLNFDINFSLTDLPLTITNSSSGTTTTAKTYLLN